MRFRRIAAAAAVAAVALMPLSSQAVGEEAKTVSGTACTVGGSTLVYDAENGEWVATTNLECTANQTSLALDFTLTQVQGVNLFPSPTYCCATMISTPPIGCFDCDSVQAQGFRNSLVPGLYALRAQAQLVQPRGGFKSGTHTTCFLVTDTSDGPATQRIPGCMI